jgi:hypothetical protein
MAMNGCGSAKPVRNEPPGQKSGEMPVNPQSVPAGGKIVKADFPNVSGEHGAGSIGNGQKPYRITRG